MKQTNYRTYNPDHEDGFYTRADVKTGEIWCPYCGGLTRIKTLEEHYKVECISYGGKT